MRVDAHWSTHCASKGTSTGPPTRGDNWADNVNWTDHRHGASVQILKFNNEPDTPERTAESVGGQEPLYGAFFGLRERPFALSPNPRFVFVSNRQREALSSLRYGLSTPHGFMLMTGEAGTGKTTMLRAVLN